jgi:hypothetical protein
MKSVLLMLASYCACGLLTAQTAITAVSTANSTSTPSTAYANGGFNYNWAVSPNNTTTSVAGFTAGGLNFSYAAFLNGIVKLRRVNNAGISGNFTLIWAEAVTSGSNYNMFTPYQNDMETFFDNRIYNQGTDNMFDNTSGNSNNIERLDWILTSGFSTAAPASVGFAVFERGAAAAHDPFCIAAITSLDASGDPATYGNIVRVAAAQYGDPGPSVSYRILKAQNPSNLLDAGSNSQTRGGVIISLQNLGVAANTTVYGYSLFSSDLPGTATAANLVDVTNATYFPLNSGNAGGIDLIAVTGIYIENLLLPAQFINVSATENNQQVQLNWQCASDPAVTNYEVQRSTNGSSFTTVATALKNSMGFYSLTDDVSGVAGDVIYYRIKQNTVSGTITYSHIVTVKHNAAAVALSIYPNPAAGMLHLSFSAAVSEKGTLNIINAAGQTVLQKDIRLLEGQNTITLAETTALTPGVYAVSVSGSHFKPVSKILRKL